MVPIPTELQAQLRDTLSRLARGDYVGLVNDGVFPRLTADELEQAVDGERYWATIVEPPEDAYEGEAMGPLDDGSGWWVEVPVWSAEEGSSDLSLIGEFVKTANGVRLVVSDLHVL